MNENQKSLNKVDSNEMTLWNIIRLLLIKFYLLAIAGVTFGIVVFLILYLFITPTYKSRVSFYVYNSSDSTAISGTINNNDLQAAESLATTYSKILESNSVLNAVLEDLGNVNGITRKDLDRMTDVAIVSDTQLLEVIVESTDAELAYKVANSYANVAGTEFVRITKAGGVEVVDRPEVATEKSSPRTIFDTAIGAAVGIIAASVVIILKAVSDTTIYLPEDLEYLENVTVLGQIPKVDLSEEKYIYWNTVNGGTVRFEGKKTKENVND